MAPISRIMKSLIRHITDMADGSLHPMTYHAWEARGEEDKLPKSTLIGLDGFNFDENTGLWVVRCAITISTYQDVNLFTEMDLLDLIFEWFSEGKRVPLRDLDSGEEDNQLVVTRFEIAPMAQTQIRNYRTVSIELKRTANDG